MIEPNKTEDATPMCIITVMFQCPDEEVASRVMSEVKSATEGIDSVQFDFRFTTLAPSQFAGRQPHGLHR